MGDNHGNGESVPEFPEQDELARTQTPPGGHSDRSFIEPSFDAAAGDFSDNKMHSTRKGRGPPHLLSTLNEGAAGAPTTPSCRKYHMESDIFGTGMRPNHSTHDNYESQTAIDNLDPAPKGKEMGAGGRSSVVQNVDWFGRGAKPKERQQMPKGVSVPDVDYEHQYEETHLAARGNARENGGNPITGQGYKEDGVSHSKRRQFTVPLAAKLW